jgi:hypothetical protein
MNTTPQRITAFFNYSIPLPVLFNWTVVVRPAIIPVCILCRRDVKYRRDIYKHFNHCPRKDTITSIETLCWLTKSMLSYVQSNQDSTGIKFGAIFAIISFCPITKDFVVIRCDGTVEAISRTNMKKQVTQAEFDRLHHIYKRLCKSESGYKEEFLAFCTLLTERTRWVLHQETSAHCSLCRPNERLPRTPFTSPIIARTHRTRGMKTGCFGLIIKYRSI